ncbi:MAG: nitronate monooxygenase [Candidatus Delongbacteria bacterium]|jgi:nitronate monooxygenase|nr:nitronate monooxygenase [Candidatus Delongbacteria bacterium]
MAKKLTEILDIEHPVLMAPMFLVSNESMMLAGLENGITAAFPAANYRTSEALDDAIQSLKSKINKPFGVNIIANKSNRRYEAELNMCVKHNVDFIITSLGDPGKAIDMCHESGIHVFCDVTDMDYAQKVVAQGADALIAVNKNAGGHPGKMDGKTFLSELLANFDVPVIYAGGVSNCDVYKDIMSWGAAGVSVGTLFLATRESPVSDEYKEALVKYGADDIVTTKKLSGAPLHVINTAYVQKTGLETNWLTRFLYRHKTLRRFLKGLAMKRGMHMLRRAAFDATYKSVWVAGCAIEDIHDIKTVKERVIELTDC